MQIKIIFQKFIEKKFSSIYVFFLCHIISLGFCAQQVRADFDSTFNLYEDQNRPLRSMKLLTQGPNSTCYAHTAQQFLEYIALDRPELFKDLNRIHPLDLATQNKIILKSKVKNIHRNDIEDSRLTWAIKNLPNMNLCKPELVTESLSGLFPGELRGTKTDEKVTFFLRSAYKAMNSKTQTYDQWLKRMSKEQDMLWWVVDTFKTSELIDRYKEKFPLITGNQALAKASQEVLDYMAKEPDFYLRLFEIVRNSKETTLLEFLSKDVFYKCNEVNARSKVMSVPKLELDTFNYSSLTSMQGTIEKRLHESQTPVIIGQCTDWLEDEKYNGKAFNRLAPLSWSRMLNQNCGQHYVMLVGKRILNDKTEFLVMNTHGPTSWMDNATTCQCRKKDTKELFESNDKKVSDDPNSEVLACWYDMSKIYRATFELYSLKL